MSALHAAAQNDALLALLDDFAERHLLGRLASAFARFMVSLGMARPAQIVAVAVLAELESRGHSCLRLDLLARDAALLLEWKEDQWQELLDASGPLPDSVQAWQAALRAAPQVLQADAADGANAASTDHAQPLVLDHDRFYLRRYWRDETAAAHSLIERAGQRRAVDPAQVRRWLDRLFDARDAASTDPDWQKIACALALRSNVAIVTGGPGTGKTYTVARLLALLLGMAQEQAPPQNLRIALAAPTGKAAARLKQAIDGALAGLEQRVADALPLAALAARIGAARTLHSLLGVRGDSRSFIHHAGNPLEVDVLIVDEASMVHLEMMAALLAALPRGALLVLLGDKDQLASVEAGAVLGELCRDAERGGYAADVAAYLQEAAGEALPAQFLGAADALAQQTTMLRKSRRFGGPIGALATAINQGDVAAAATSLRSRELAQDDGAAVQALAWLERAQQKQLLALALDGREGAGGGYRPYLRLLAQRPRDASREDYELWVGRLLGAFENFRILCAVREGEWGVTGLNRAIEKELDGAGLIARRGDWYAGRPVMIGRNDAAANVFNGDIGVALPDPLRAGALRVYFLDGATVRSVLATRLRHVETAYAMTVHKSQGSEFRHTVLVLPPVSSPVLTRELVYTGVTRARASFTLVTPNPTVLDEAIRRRTERASGLRELLNEASQTKP